MDPSALESVSRSLESSLDFWGSMLLAATLVVVVGLIVEYWHEIRGFWEHARWPMAAFPSDKLVAITGGVLVTLGVAGELFFTYKASLVESKLRENNHKIEALLTKEAGDAKTSAEGAADASSRAKRSADAAGVAAAKAQEQVNLVAKRAEEIDAGLGQTQSLMSARSVENRDELTDKLKLLFKGQDVIVRSYVGDQESWGLCTQLWYLAQSAEMKPANECGMGQLTAPLASPLVISGPDIDETMKLADLLVHIGRVGGWSGIKAPILTIFVGIKSPFMIGQARGVKAPTKKQSKQQTSKP